MNDFIVLQINTKTMSLYDLYEDSVLNMYLVAFRYQGQGHLWVKRSSWKKINLYQCTIYSRISIFCYMLPS